jgi:Fur family ferric uptake transcriptional regulator
MQKEHIDLLAMQTLKSVGIAHTPKRLAVLNVLLKTAKPLSAVGIRQAITTCSRIDKVTVYRIIALFRKQGIIREIISANGANYFEMASLDNPVHPHFECRHCGQLSCLAPLTFSSANQLISANNDYSIDHIEINISGLCAGCRNATKLHKQSNRGTL